MKHNCTHATIKAKTLPPLYIVEEEVETKQVDRVLTHSNWCLSQEEASMKQEENKGITPEPWWKVEDRSDFVNIWKLYLLCYHSKILLQ